MTASDYQLNPLWQTDIPLSSTRMRDILFKLKKKKKQLNSSAPLYITHHRCKTGFSWLKKK